MKPGPMLAQWILRIACAGIFAGHGVLALRTNESWLAFFPVVGISESSGRTLMPMVGVLDVFLAILVLVHPVRIALVWMTAWAFWTALLRPLSGQSILELVERTGNWGAPLALLLLMGARRRPPS